MAEITRISNVAKRRRTCLMVEASFSLAFQLHVVVGRGERPAVKRPSMSKWLSKM